MLARETNVCLYETMLHFQEQDFGVRKSGPLQVGHRLVWQEKVAHFKWVAFCVARKSDPLQVGHFSSGKKRVNPGVPTR
jgi:hypothetical protein